MAEYYLISQLPSLDGIGENSMLPITEERYLELCKSFLGARMLNELENLTLIPPLNPQKSRFAIVEAWNDRERNLRLALAKVRADKMNKSFEIPKGQLSAEILKAANSAAETVNPLEAEKFLLNYRLSFLETLRPTDSFSDEYIFYYALKLKLILRIREFDKRTGEINYKNIYSEIVNGNRSEV